MGFVKWLAGLFARRPELAAECGKAPGEPRALPSHEAWKRREARRRRKAAKAARKRNRK